MKSLYILAEQARLDGAFCCFTADEKAEFLQRASQDRDIRNIEMESSCFTAFCGRANLQCKRFGCLLHKEAMFKFYKHAHSFVVALINAITSGAVVCAALVDRLRRDDVTSDRKTLAEWEAAPVRLVTAYIKKNLWGVFFTKYSCSFNFTLNMSLAMRSAREYWNLLAIVTEPRAKCNSVTDGIGGESPPLSLYFGFSVFLVFITLLRSCVFWVFSGDLGFQYSHPHPESPLILKFLLCVGWWALFS